MKTAKNNLGYQIKKQIEEREIAPSRDLWSEIEMQSSQNNSKSNLNWFLVAACLVLAFGLGAVLYNTNKNNTETVIVKKTDSPETGKNRENKIINSPSGLKEQKERQAVAIENVPAYERSGKNDPQISSDAKELPLIKENISEITLDISQTPPAKILAQTDSLKTPAKRKRYVDPSTLLFSVEHKDVIEKTKEGSNVATIDLNAK